jgi:hypothetical protein
MPAQGVESPHPESTARTICEFCDARSNVSLADGALHDRSSKISGEIRFATASGAADLNIISLHMRNMQPPAYWAQGCLFDASTGSRTWRFRCGGSEQPDQSPFVLCCHAPMPLAKPDFRHGNRRGRRRIERSNARAGFGWLWRGNRTDGASRLDHDCDSYGRLETAEVFDRITNIGVLRRGCRYSYFVQHAGNSDPKLLFVSSQPPISQMVVARFDDMLPALWQTDYSGNTARCYAVMR